MKKEEFKALIPAFESLTGKMKALFSSDAPADAPADDTVKASETEAQDGTKIKIEGEVAPGSKVTVLSQDGTEVPAPDGDLILKDGSTLSIKDGLILEVKAPQDPANTGEMKDQPFAKEVESLSAKITEMSEKLAAYEKANAILMAKVEKQDAVIGQAKEVISDTFKVVEQLAGLPAEKPIEDKKQLFKKEDKLAQLANALKSIKPQSN